MPDAVKEAVSGVSTGEGPQLLWPPNGSVVDTPNPNFRARAAVAEGDTIDFYFEVDRLPTFDGEFLQRSSDRPLLYEVLWEDLRFTGTRKITMVMAE